VGVSLGGTLGVQVPTQTPTPRPIGDRAFTALASREHLAYEVRLSGTPRPRGHQPRLGRTLIAMLQPARLVASGP